MADFSLKSAQFRNERQQSWLELDALVTRIERRGFRSLTAPELNRLPSLYRSAVSSLSVARAISLDRNLLLYLEGLVGRAYISIYGTKRRARDAIFDFITWRLPDTFRRYVWFVVAATAVTVLGAITGYVLTSYDSERYYSFVSEAMAGGRNPAASTESLKAALYDTGSIMDALTIFASSLFTHNAQIGLMAFVLGFAFGAPVLFLLFYNGMTLGAFASLYGSRGLGFEFWAWVLPHGVTELSAIILSGAAGLILGMSILFPGPHTRLQNLAIRGRDAAVIAVGAVAMFFVAGMIEGFFRQIVQNIILRWMLAGGTMVFWTWYYFFVGRKREAPSRA